MPESFLVIDDSKLLHQMYRLIFSQGDLAGSTVHYAANGREGYALLAAHPELTLVLLDLNMPEMNGLEVLARRQAEHLHPERPGRAGHDRGKRGGRGARPRGRRLGLSPEAVPAVRHPGAGATGPRAEAEPGSGMTQSENPFGDLLQDYIVECLPLSEQVGDAFVELERRWQAGEPGDDLLTTVKGRLHTIKGNSAMMGFGPARDVAHALEDACGFLGRAPDARTADAAALLVAGGGLLVELVGGASPELDPAPAAAFVERVRGYLAAAPGAASARSDRRHAERRGPRSDEGEAAGNTVRIDFRRLDAMLEVLGEGLIQHSSLVELYRRLLAQGRSVCRAGGAGPDGALAPEDADPARVHADGDPPSARLHRARAASRDWCATWLMPRARKSAWR